MAVGKLGGKGTGAVWTDTMAKGEQSAICGCVKYREREKSQELVRS